MRSHFGRLITLVVLSIFAISFFVASAFAGQNEWTLSSLRNYTWPSEWSLSFSPDFASDDTMFSAVERIGLPAQIYRSEDKGASWSLVHEDDILSYGFSDLAVSPDYSNDGTIFASILSGNADIIRSTNGGASWEPVLCCGRHTTTVELSPDYANDRTVFTATINIIRYSTDGGNSSEWASVDVGDGVLDLAFSPEFASNDTLYAATENGVIRSEDAGATWEKVTQDIGNPGVRKIGVASSGGGDHVFAASGSGVLRSRDGGDTWSTLDIGADPELARDIAISPAYASDQTVHVAVLGEGVFKSTDEGAAWSPFNNGLFELTNNMVEVSPDYANDGMIFSGTANTWLFWYALTNAGVTRSEEENDAITYSPSSSAWSSTDRPKASAYRMRYSLPSGNKASFSFTGKKVEYVGAMCNRCGEAKVYVDGILQTTLDLYSRSNKYQQVLYTKRFSNTGAHTLKIQPTGTKNSASRGKLVGIDAFQVTN